jgi:hypothetical protein
MTRQVTDEFTSKQTKWLFRGVPKLTASPFVLYLTAKKLQSEYREINTKLSHNVACGLAERSLFPPFNMKITETVKWQLRRHRYGNHKPAPGRPKVIKRVGLLSLHGPCVPEHDP